MRVNLFPAILLSLFVLLFPAQAFASVFSNAYVRLNNQMANAALSGTFCAKPSAPGTGTESSITITFPSDFSISSNTSNWTTSVSNLSSGENAWPGIGANATSVSGQSVTFASSDLTASSLYCFNFSSTLSQTASSAGNSKAGVATTKDASSTTIDSTAYALSIVANDKINITATINPYIADLPISIASLTPGTQFPQNSTIGYQITYGLNTIGAFPLTIQASWSQGTIDGSPTPSVDILNYVVGSATNAYGGTAPVIDTVNRTITWTISSVPGGTTGQTVNFSLQTNSSYTGSSLVHFTVSAKSTSGTTTTPNQSVNQDYLFSGTLPASGGTGDGLSDGRSDGKSSSSPSQPSASLFFKSIDIVSVSSTQTQILVTTNIKANLSISYGTSINNLSKNIKTLAFNTQDILKLTDLEPETDYYFKIIAKDEKGNTKTSDIFTFKTASVSQSPLIDLQSLVVTSNNIILLNPQAQTATGQNPAKYSIFIPQDTVFEIHFALKKSTQIKSIQAIVKNKNVLGINTFSTPQDANSNYVDLVETRPGIYTGRILSPKNIGNYELYIKILDYSGNITLQKVAEIRVTHKFMVFEKETKIPVENARVLFYLYNPTTKVYEVISPQILPINNPSYSQNNGTVGIVLPRGRYGAEISGIGYSFERAEFEISSDSGDYPTVYLTKQPFNIGNTISYYATTFADALNASQNYIKVHADSNRLFDFSAFATIFVFVAISVLSISARTHIGVFYLPYFLMFKLMILFKKSTGRIIFGKVLENETNIPLSRSFVYILSFDTSKIITTLKTNKLGEFYYNNPKGEDFKIKITKDGFNDSSLYDFKNSQIKEIPIVFKLKNKGKIQRSLFQVIFIYLEDFLGMGMEALILLGFLVQIYFVFTFGLLRVLPFLILTVLNITLIFIYLYKPRSLSS